MKRIIIVLLILFNANFLWAEASRDFDGVNDKVAFGDIPLLSDATVLTVLIHIYSDNLTQDHYIAGVGIGPGVVFINDDVGSTSGRTNTFTIFVQESSAAGGTSAKIEGATNAAKQMTWQSIAFTFLANNSTGLKLYIDGVEDVNSPVSTSNIAEVGLSNLNWAVGMRDSDSAIDRAGLEAYFQAWNRVLEIPEISQAEKFPCSIPENLVICVPLWGDTIEKDLSGNGYSGTVTGAIGSNEGPAVMLNALPI